MPEARELSQAGNCSVIAPAGCGKTELIARAVQATPAGRSLILTHTHAGVKALRDRMLKYRIDSSRVRIDTIAGWSLRYASAYPASSGLQVINPVRDQWNLTYAAAARLLELQSIRRVVAASYRDVYEDEYQDCSLLQHNLICRLAGILPVRILGDPLQGIFGFRDQSVRWGEHVLPTFPQLRELDTPWRWRGRNEQLGAWLLWLRGPLQRGEAIDLGAAPVTWAPLSPDAQRRQAYRLHALDGSIIALRKWPNASHEFSRSMAGLYRSMEEMECNALMDLARDLPNLQGPARAARVFAFAGDCMTGLRDSIGTLWTAAEQRRYPEVRRLRTNQELANAVIEMGDSDDPSRLLRVSQLLEAVEGTRLFRTELWRAFQRTVTDGVGGGYEALEELAWEVRNRNRFTGRTLDRRTSSRTLLVKGLECDHSLVLDLDEYEDPARPGDGAKHAYVALTRGAASLTVLSAAPRIRFSPPAL